MGWKWGTKSKWYNGHKRKQANYDLNYDRQGNTRMNHWATTWTTGSTRWAKRTTNRQQRAANKLCIAYELYEDEEWQIELWEQQIGFDDIEEAEAWEDYLDREYDREFCKEDYFDEPEEDQYDPYWYDDYYGDY